MRRPIPLSRSWLADFVTFKQRPAVREWYISPDLILRMKVNKLIYQNVKLLLYITPNFIGHCISMGQKEEFGIVGRVESHFLSRGQCGNCISLHCNDSSSLMASMGSWICRAGFEGGWNASLVLCGLAERRLVSSFSRIALLRVWPNWWSLMFIKLMEGYRGCS